MTDGKIKDDEEARAEDRGESAAEAAMREGADDLSEIAAEDAAMHISEADEAGVVDEEPVDDMEAALTTALAERDELRERLMRALAETENVRKRAERDVKDAQAYAGTKLARDLLGVVDNLSRALLGAGQRVGQLHEAGDRRVESEPFQVLGHGPILPSGT